MGIQSTFYNTSGGDSRKFPSTKFIASKSHVAVYGQDADTLLYDIYISAQDYDLVFNAVVFYDVVTYDSIEIRVADTPDELTDNPSAITIVAGSIDSVNALALNIDDVNDVADYIEKVVAVNDTIIPELEEILLADTNAAIATAKAVEASASAVSSASSASASAISASASLASENASATSETNASTSAIASAISATEASVSAASIVGDRDAAEASAIAAAVSAAASLSSANSSATGAINAQGSAGTAIAKAAEASTSATIALGSATTATTKAAEAAASALEAQGYADSLNIAEYVVATPVLSIGASVNENATIVGTVAVASGSTPIVVANIGTITNLAQDSAVQWSYTYNAHNITDGDDDIAIISCHCEDLGKLDSAVNTINITVSYVPVVADTAYQVVDFTGEASLNDGFDLI